MYNKKSSYIDLGCFDGDSVIEFYKQDPEHEEWEVYAFDPNPRYKDTWKRLEKLHKHLKFECSAAMPYAGEALFTIRPESAPYGSTLNQDKQDFGDGEVVGAKCFNFSDYIIEFKDHDLVIVKMDIEGSEYAVIEQLLDRATIENIDVLKVEFHDRRMLGRQEEYSQWRQALLSRLEKTNCSVVNW